VSTALIEYLFMVHGLNALTHDQCDTSQKVTHLTHRPIACSAAGIALPRRWCIL